MLKQFLYSLRSKHSSPTANITLPMADVYENDLLKNSRSFSERVYFKKKDLYDSSVLIKLYLCMFGGEKGNLYQKNL